jgi:hypothetical protein
MSPQLELLSFLRIVRRRWLRVVRLRALARALAGVAALAGIFAVIGRRAALAPDGLLVAATGALALAVAWVWWTLRRSWRAPDDRRVARFVEERCPAFEDGLVTAVEVRDRDDLRFASWVLADAAARARAVDPLHVIDRRTVARAAGRVGLAVALVVAAGAAAVDPGLRAAQAGWLRLAPHLVSLDVQPGDARAVAGEPFWIEARLGGVPGGASALRPVVTLGEAGRSRTVAMSAAGDRFRLEIPRLERSFTYRVTAGGVRSDEYTVTVLHPPRVVGIDVAYAYPPHTGLAPRVDENGGDVYAPAGTRVTLRVRSDKPLAAGAVRFAGGREVALAPAAAARAREAAFTVDRDASYRVTIVDADGLRGGGDTEYFVRVTADRPPEVRILRPAGDRQATPLEEVLIEARAEDDYRVGALELVYAVGGGPERRVALGGRAGPVVTGGHVLALEELGVRPGDVVRYYAQARESGRAPRARVARSEMFFLEVVPYDQEFALAQSQAMAAAGGGADASLEALAAAQKQIVGATWNLLRRSEAGRSEADVRALARAQGELQQRAQAFGGPMRLSGRRGRGRQAAPPPLEQAAEAMGRAREALERLQLSAALPHEMEALNQILRAIAEVRRRQVAQQRASSAGGYGRSGQDLSALFDRELLRQQATNYETRASVSQDRAQQESEALARVRELARRQDELARQQQALARARLDEAERRRRLERLAREQEELRRQAEALERETQQRQGGQSSAGSPSEAMRGAEGELRRGDAGAAGRRAETAAERLRELERSLASGASGGERRSMAELQLESQRIAEAQRRLADRAARTGAAGDDRRSAEDERRLADEQRRLADRVEALERAARAAAASGTTPERRASADAAGEIRRGRVAERMREMADALRRGSDSRAGAERGRREATARTGDELARTMDRVAERLGSAADAEAQRTARELARARERLESLQRQIEALERRARGATGAQGGGDGAAEELRAQLRRELQRAQRLLDEVRRGMPTSGMGGATPEEHEFSRSAPAFEAFKQDYSRWEELRRNIELAIERRELALARRLAAERDQRRLAATLDGLPADYRALVARYFEALARAGRRP